MAKRKLKTDAAESTAKKGTTAKGAAKKSTAAKGTAKKSTVAKGTAKKSPALKTSTAKKKSLAKDTVPTATKSKKVPITKRRKKKVDEEQIMKDVAAELEREAKTALKSKRKKKSAAATKGKKVKAAKATTEDAGAEEKGRGTRKKAGKTGEAATPDSNLTTEAAGAAEKPSKRKKRKYRRRATATETPVIMAKYQGKKISDASMMPILESAKALKPENTVSYKKDELEKFRVLMINKINDATDELQSIEERLMDSTSGESGEEDSTYSLHMADQGTDAMEREKAFLFAARERKFISHLSDALQRIKSGNYGVCITCGQLIDKGRLEAVPHARMCVDCKTQGKNL